MAESDPNAPMAPLSQTYDGKRSERDRDVRSPEMAAGQDFDPGPARPDPETGEVRAGPGDAGLENRPEVNAGNAGIEQISNSRLAIGLGIAAVLTVLGLLVRALF